MAVVRRFMAKQIPVSASLPKRLIAGLFPLPNGKSNRRFRPAGFDLAHQLAHSLIGKPGVLPTLQDKGAESQRPSRFTAGKNLLRTQAVPHCVPVAAANPAVIAVIFAEIADFNQPADKNPFAVIGFPGQTGQTGGFLCQFRRLTGNQGFPLGQREGVGFCQLMQKREQVHGVSSVTFA